MTTVSALLIATTLPSPPAGAAAATSDDQLTQLNEHRVDVFTNWLRTYQVPGEISEVGWPGDRSASENAEWNTLASKIYARVAAAGVPVAYWGVNEGGMLDPFQSSGSQLSVLRGQPGSQRGINLGGGEYGGNYPSNDTIDKAAAAGFAWVRIPFNWEKLQPSSMGPLDAGAVQSLQNVVNRALADGMTVEIDNHNYARYNGSWTTDTQLSNFWSKLAPLFPDHRVSFGVMNEPYQQPANTQSWAHISQAVVTAIRAAGSTNLLSIEADHWSNAYYWSCQDAKPWITDPADNYRYDAHTYFDADTSGQYSGSYDNTYNQAQSWGSVALSNQCPSNPVSSSTPPAPQPGGGGMTTTTTAPPTTTTTTMPTTTPTTTTTPPASTTTTSTTTPSVPTTTTTTTLPSSPSTTTTTTPSTLPSNTSTTTTTTPSNETTTTSTPVVGTTLTGLTTSGDNGYRVVTQSGTVYAFGGASNLGSAPAGAGITAIASTPSQRGYWLAGADGTVYPFGDAVGYGGMNGKSLNAPVVGMASTADGGGYWLLGRDGGIFSFGDAKFYGSTGSIKLNAPVVSMTTAPNGNGYWFVAADGGVFSYGAGATFSGSTGGMHLNKPVVSMAAAPSGTGYWLVASDGGIFSFGTPFYGSAGSLALNAPVVAMVVAPGGTGYRLVAADGGVFAYGSAPFAGSLGSTPPNSPIIGIGG